MCSAGHQKGRVEYMKRIVGIIAVAVVLLCSCHSAEPKAHLQSQQPTSKASIAEVADQTPAPCPNGNHEPWEDYIAQPLIDYVGEQAYLDFVEKSTDQGQCADIYRFLFEFDVPYETFITLTEKDTQYDIRKITTSTYSWVIENEWFERLFIALCNERRQQLTDAVKERIDSYRDGTFEEMPNHHPAYPEYFPPAKNLPEITDFNDYSLYFIKQVGNGSRSYTGGGIYVVIWVDDTHQIVLNVNDFGDFIGFGYSGFYSGDMLFDTSNAILAHMQ